MLCGLRGLNLVGGDVVEVSPPFDMSAQGPDLTPFRRPRHLPGKRRKVRG
jgi:hypothetical protein